MKRALTLFAVLALSLMLFGCSIAVPEDVETMNYGMPGEPAPSAEWPQTGAIAQVPAFSAGDTSALVENTNSLTAYYENVDMAEVEEYIGALEAAGFGQNVQSYTDESTGVFSYFADNGTGMFIALSYSGGAVGIDISYNS